MYKNSLLKKFKKTDLYLDNFPHILIENALDEEFYNELCSNFPNFDLFSDDQLIKENVRYDISSTNYKGTSFAWKEFLEYHSSAEFFKSIISIFDNEIKNSGNNNLLNLLSKKNLTSGSLKKDLKENKIDIWHDVSVNINTKVSRNNPSVRTPHLDNPTKIYGGLFYMKNPKDKCRGGNLELYKFKDKKKYMGNAVPSRFVKKISQVDYKENNLIIFLNSDNSIHGVTPRTNTEFSRRFVYFHATSNKIKMHEASFGQVSKVEKFLAKVKNRLTITG